MDMKLPRVEWDDGGPDVGATWAFGVWASETERRARLAGRGPVRVSGDGVAPVVSLAGDGSLFVRLSGTGPGYTATPVFPTPGNSWGTYSSDPTFTAWEENGVTGLTGKVVKVFPAAGEWRFRYRRGGGGGGPANPCLCTFPATLSFSDFGVFDQSTTPVRVDTSGVSYPITLTYGPSPGLPSEARAFYPTGDVDKRYITLPENAWYSGALPGVYFGSAVNVYVVAWINSCQLRAMAYYDGVYYLYLPTTVDEAKHACTPLDMGRPVSFGGAPVYTTFVTGTHSGSDIVPDTGGSTPGPRNLRDGPNYSLYQNPPVGTAFVSGTTTYQLFLASGTVQIRLFFLGTVAGTRGPWTPGPGDSVAWTSSDPSVASVASTPSVGTVNLSLHALGPFTLTGVLTTTHPQPSGSLTMTQNYTVG